MVPATYAHTDEHVAALRGTVERGQRIMIVGGPSGTYGPHIARNEHVEHFVSEESKSQRDANFTVRSGVGAILLTKFVSHRLSQVVIREAEAAGVEVYGIFRSPGSVNRLLDTVFDRKHFHPEAHQEMKSTIGDAFAAKQKEEPVPAAKPVIASSPVPTVQAVVVAEEPAPRVPTLTDENTEAVVLQVFAEAEAALAIAKETAIAAIRKARESADRASANESAAQTLAALRAMLTGGAK